MPSPPRGFGRRNPGTKRREGECVVAYPSTSSSPPRPVKRSSAAASPSTSPFGAPYAFHRRAAAPPPSSAVASSFFPARRCCFTSSPGAAVPARLPSADPPRRSCMAAYGARQVQRLASIMHGAL